jgi:tryptophan 2,3-dioxygenase
MSEGIATHPLGAGTDGVAPDGHIYNSRGVIAENYYDLQGLGILRTAREEHPVEKASARSSLRAIYQAVELGLLNLADITARAAADLADGPIGASLVKMYWARGFHRVLLRLSVLPHHLGFPLPADDGTALQIRESPAFAEYAAALRAFDAAVARRLDSGELQLDTLLAHRSLDDVELALLHVARICNHESTIWEHNLSDVRVPSPVRSYADFVVAGRMREAVYDRVLKGDTYFTQFRGLHQIPETLGEEVNDQAEQAIRDVRAHALRSAFDHLRCANILTEGMLAAVAPMADNLATADYHEIRENLGLTSGSHSVCLRFHLFGDIYKQLWEAVESAVSRTTDGTGQGAEAAVRRLDSQVSDDGDAWLLQRVLGECLTLRTFVHQWREQHLHMPRNNLGGGYTKSLTGSPDAILAVKKMRNAADASDVMRPLVRARGLPESRPEETHPIARYLDSPESLDARLLTATGRVTQGRFQDVQHRLGFFAQKCPFAPPSTRRV